jgi:hypothetical protein
MGGVLNRQICLRLVTAFIKYAAQMKPAIYDMAYHLKATSKPPIENEIISGEMFGKGIIARLSFFGCLITH